MPEKYREKCREQRAESRKQRAESSGRCPPGDKTHLAGGGGHRPIHGPQDRDRHQNSEASGPPGGAGGAVVPSRRGAAGQRKR